MFLLITYCGRIMILAISAKNREKINTNFTCLGRVPTSTGVGGRKKNHYQKIKNLQYFYSAFEDTLFWYIEISQYNLTIHPNL